MIEQDVRMSVESACFKVTFGLIEEARFDFVPPQECQYTRIDRAPADATFRIWILSHNRSTCSMNRDTKLFQDAKQCQFALMLLESLISSKSSSGYRTS